MKSFLIYLLIVIALIGIIMAFTYGSRYISNVSTPITVTEVEKGIKCASMNTAGGVALSCWKM